jgi:uncharacterized protein
MQPRVTLITLGVTDLDRSISFYRSMGWERHSSSVEGEVAFFAAGGAVLAVWDRAKLAHDSAVTDGGGWGGVTLAHNVRTEAEADDILAAAARAGGNVGRAGAPTPWGGYSGVFLDPDGHPWEIAVNPGWPLRDDGTVSLG